MASSCSRLLTAVQPAKFLFFIRRFCSSLKEVNSFTWRTHTCGELTSENIGQEVTLCGWIQFQRFSKFVIVKDAYGMTQILFDEHDSANRNFAFSLPLESVIQVTGIAQKRPEGKINKKLHTGEIEIMAKEVKLLNACSSNLPFTSRDYEKTHEPVKQKYRYVSLRMQRSQEILRMRSSFIMKMRDFLHNHHSFIEVETPTLFRRTPGGAKEFIVPTKFPGRFYSLVQSPQQFKQMLMVGAIDRYFQICRCYRNEGTKTDRQPEFTQVDIEASFTTEKDIRCLVEELLVYSWPREKHKISIPFPCMTYSDAMRIYGTDKPDIRYDMKIHDLKPLLNEENIGIFNQAVTDSDSIIGAISLPLGSKHAKKTFLAELKEKAKEYGFPDIVEVRIKQDFKWNSFVSKHISENARIAVNERLNVKPDDLVLIVAGKEENVKQFLGKIRVQCAEHLQSFGIDVYKKNILSFVWIVNFPLFVKGENGELESAHHPFTAPRPEDVDCVYTDPLKAHGQHYDLVLNGQEVGGGSIRVHDSSLQKYMLDEVLKEDSSSLQHLLDALACGCPPHGGIALGLDRLLAIMFDCNSISEVIAFPKSLDGKDLLSGAPSSISEEDKALYHIEPKFPTS